MKLKLLFISIIIGTIVILPQEKRVEEIGIKNPAAISNGFVFTNAKYSALYVEQDGEQILLTSSPGCGLYYSLSTDKQIIGYKQIDLNGNQIPSLIDISTKTVTHLSNPVESAGQVSFADNGDVAFTVGKELIVRKVEGEKKYDLGTYSNISPISPDGKYVAFNNNYDQLFLLNLSNGEKQKMTNDNGSYFNPIWSLDGKKLLYSSLAGTLKVYDLESKKTYTIAKEGRSPAWSNDSRQIIFYKKEIEDYKLINSDLYLSNYEGTNQTQITSTKDQFECDPSFGLKDDEIIYSRLEAGSIVKANLSLENSSVKNQKEIEINLQPVETPTFKLNKKVLDVDTLDIPYINQVYDTPDYYNGSAACGPTSAMMIVAFYKILPVWNITCSWPSSHISPYGRYICDPYRFRQTNYVLTANDPNDRPSQGAYGYMWSGTSPYSSMVSFYIKHGISAARARRKTLHYLQRVNGCRTYYCGSWNSNAIAYAYF